MATPAFAIRRSSKARSPRAGSGPPRRALTATFHLLVSILAILSLCTNRFDLWIDLRLLGPVLTTFVKILWAATVLLVPVCAGPRLGGWKSPRWILRGFAPEWAEAFLWPTYFLLLCLLINTVWWFMLVAHGVYLFDLPITLYVALLLGGWLLLTREWLRHLPRLPPTAPATRRTQLLGGVLGLLATAAGVGFFFLTTYALPPRQPVDLAVVLGNRVMPDGSASIILRERTEAAIHLYQAGFARHLLLSGAVEPPATAGGPSLSEPIAMRAVCLDHRLPADAFSLDPAGVNTRATAYNTRRFMEAHGYTTVVACTSEAHPFRTAMSLRQEGLSPSTVRAIPALWICSSPLAFVREVVGIVVYAFDPHYRPAATTPPPEVAMSRPRVVVHKSANTLELFDGNQLRKRYACITGGNLGDKETEGDRRTPVGSFHIVYKNPNSKFHLSMGLDYPNKEDAQRGLDAGLITRQQYEDILSALGSDLSLEENQKKLWYTRLGGEIFLHGHGEGRTGTAGCVALANSDIDELFAILPIGTPVEIQP